MGPVRSELLYQGAVLKKLYCENGSKGDTI